jgi:large-conductance mechanosensitive channel
MSIQDIITEIILVILCITFMIFVIAKVIRAEQESSKKRINKAIDEDVAKYWEELNKEDKDE